MVHGGDGRFCTHPSLLCCVYCGLYVQYRAGTHGRSRAVRPWKTALLPSSSPRPPHRWRRAIATLSTLRHRVWATSGRPPHATSAMPPTSFPRAHGAARGRWRQGVVVGGGSGAQTGAAGWGRGGGCARCSSWHSTPPPKAPPARRCSHRRTRPHPASHRRRPPAPAPPKPVSLPPASHVRYITPLWYISP